MWRSTLTLFDSTKVGFRWWHVIRLLDTKAEELQTCRPILGQAWQLKICLHGTPNHVSTTPSFLLTQAMNSTGSPKDQTCIYHGKRETCHIVMFCTSTAIVQLTLTSSGWSLIANEVTSTKDNVYKYKYFASSAKSDKGVRY